MATVRRHRGRSAKLFGSVARAEERPDSDLDFLVDFESDSSLLDVVRLQHDLEQLLDHNVDVVSSGALKERDDHIRREATAL